MSTVFSSLPMMVILAIVAMHSAVVSGHGICYSPFHDDDYFRANGNHQLMNKILNRDLAKIKQNCFNRVRTFYSSFYGVSVADAAKAQNIEIALGARIDDGPNPYPYERFEKKAIESALKSGSTSHIISILVGNENVKNGGHGMRDISNMVGKINEYKTIVKSAGKNIPVGTSQRINEWLMGDNQIGDLMKASDVIGVNIYPFFTHSGAGTPLERLNTQWKQVKDAVREKCGADCVKKIQLTETGWPTKGREYQGNVPSLENAEKYFADYQKWAQENNQKESSFYFKFFDLNEKEMRGQSDFEQYFGVNDNNAMRFNTCTSVKVSVGDTTGCTKTIDNIDYAGNDIRKFHVGKNFQRAKALCCAGCKAERKCKAFTIFRGKCYLKHSTNGASPKAGAISGRYSRKVRKFRKCSTPKKNIDFFGNDIGQLRVGTDKDAYGACCEACGSTEGNRCKGFTIANGVCYLKHSVHVESRTSPSRHIVSGTLHAGNCPNLQVNYDWAGGDLWNFETSSIAEKGVSQCCDKCKTTRECKRWTHYQRRCYLKNSKVAKGVFKFGATSSE